MKEFEHEFMKIIQIYMRLVMLIFLITYTCDVCPTLEQQKVLRDFVANGKRWFALHGTNSILQF